MGLIIILAAVATGLALVGFIVWRMARGADRRDQAWRATGGSGVRARQSAAAATGLYSAGILGAGSDAGCDSGGGGDGGGCN